MKKRMLSMLLAMVLLVCSAGIIAEAASLELKGTVGEAASWVLYQGKEDSVLTLTESGGTIPAGMSISQSADKLILSGTPTASGKYTVIATVSDKSEQYVTEENPEGIQETAVSASITVEPRNILLAAYENIYDQGEDISITISHSGVKFGEAEVFDGKVPEGLTISSDATNIYIKGKAEKAGEFKFSIRCFDSISTNYCHQPVVIVVLAGETEPEKVVPKVTKDPTGESVAEGESAVFIARADNAKTITWYLVSANDKTELDAKTAANQFTGLQVNGYDGEKLTLSNIPMTLDGWKAKAKFTSEDGESVWSKAATISVRKAELKEPTITTQPRGTELDPDQTTVLKVSAVSPDGNKLVYQWYMNDKASNSGGRAIDKATESSYTPEYIEGTTYYYCAVRNSTGTDISAAVKTEAVAVTYRAAEAEEPETTEPETTEDLWEDGEPEETIRFDETTRPTENSKPQKQSRSILPVILAIIVCITVIVVCAVLLVLRYLPRKDEEEEEFDPEDFDETPNIQE